MIAALLLSLLFPFGDDVLARAEHAYRAGDYEGARKAWSAYLQRHDDGRVEYNLGNCAFRLGDYARALWRYERARRRLGDREEVLFNRSLAIRKLGLAEDGARGLADSVVRRLRSWEGADWFRLGLPLELGGLVLLVLAVRRRAFLWRLLAVLVLVTGVLALVQSLRVPEGRVLGAVVLQSRTPLRSEPRADLPATLTLAAGVRAEFRAETPDWIKVRVLQREGWIERERVGLW